MECLHIPTIDYTQIDERLHEKASGKRTPLNGSFELTFRCNLRCAHCYCNVPLNDQSEVNKELTKEEVFHISDQLADAGCLWLLLTGGEPLVRNDFLQIYNYMKKKGFIISVFTNGTLITPKIADYLAEWPPFTVEITLYGITEETYERVTGTPGSFKNCIRGIDLLLERKIPLGLKTMVTTQNRHELWQIKEYADNLGVNFRFDAELNPRLDRSQAPCEFRLSPEEVVKLDLLDEKRMKEWQQILEKSTGLPKSDNLYMCGAGISTFHVDPCGYLSVCEMSRFHNYNLRREPFKEGWYRAIPEFLAYKPALDSPCSRCHLTDLCSQCPGWSWLETGNLKAPVEYLCRIAHLRWDVFHRGELKEKERGKWRIKKNPKSLMSNQS